MGGRAMKRPRRRSLHLIAGAAALQAVSRIAWGQAYPTRPVRLVVAYAAGIGLDILARLMGHVWTAPAVQEESDYQRSVRVRSCIRPFSAAVWPLALM